MSRNRPEVDYGEGLTEYEAKSLAIKREAAKVSELLYRAMNDCAFDVANWELYKELQEWHEKHEAKMAEDA